MVEADLDKERQHAAAGDGEMTLKTSGANEPCPLSGSSTAVVG